MNTSRTVGRNVRIYRLLHGMRQEDLAEKLGPGWHRQTISLIESGKRPVKVDELCVFAATFGVAPDRLLVPVLGKDFVASDGGS